MSRYREVEGNLIDMALEGNFDIITHGCNCFSRMGAGIAPFMAKHFFADRYLKELSGAGDYNKLGQIDYQNFEVTNKEVYSPLYFGDNRPDVTDKTFDLTVVNSYTQYYYGSHPSNNGIPLDYTALRMCMKKINHTFAGKIIGLPLIGCGLAKGDWAIVSQIIKEELKDMYVIIVKLPQ